MLLDPFEKKLHRPTSLVELADHQCWQVKIIGQKDERSVLLLITKADASQRSRVMFFGPRAFQANGLVASQALRLVDPSGFNDVKACVTLVAHDKAGALLVQRISRVKSKCPRSITENAPGSTGIWSSILTSGNAASVMAAQMGRLPLSEISVCNFTALARERPQ